MNFILKSRWPWKKILLFMSGMMTILLCFFIKSLPDNKLHVFVLDVGQGDSILVKTPANERILVDGGPDDTVLRQMAKVMPFYEKKIDVVILTHPHADHVNGLVQVLRRYRVGTVLMTGVHYDYPGYESFFDEIHKKNIPLLFANGSDYRLGKLILDMIYPFASLQGKSFENQNNGSIVFRLLYGKRSFYFSGDMEMEGEEKLVSSHLDLHADFLKAPHHGSKTSDTLPFLDRVKPEYAVISCGAGNKFGHPSPVTLQHLHAFHIQTYRTDLDGTVEAVSDGIDLQLRAFGKN